MEAGNCVNFAINWDIIMYLSVALQLQYSLIYTNTRCVELLGTSRCSALHEKMATTTLSLANWACKTTRQIKTNRHN